MMELIAPMRVDQDIDIEELHLIPASSFSNASNSAGLVSVLPSVDGPNTGILTSGIFMRCAFSLNSRRNASFTTWLTLVRRPAATRFTSE